MIIRSRIFRPASCRAVLVPRSCRFLATDPPPATTSNTPAAQSTDEVPQLELQLGKPEIPQSTTVDDPVGRVSNTTEKAARQQSPRRTDNIRANNAGKTRSNWGMPQNKAISVQKYLIKQHERKTTSRLGSRISWNHLPAQILLNPPKPSDVTLELLLACGAHLGHKPSLWNPGNSQYIFGTRDGIHILSLEAIAAHLRRAAKVVEGVALNGGLILFVGTKASLVDTVVKAAQMVKGCHVFRKWKPGTITNGEALLHRSKMKVVNEKDEEVPGFEEQLRKRAIVKPDLVICLNPRENDALLRECGIHMIPTIGIIDTNTDPTSVTYPIPANDDSLRCVQTVAMVLASAGQAGNEARLEKARRGEVTYDRDESLKPLYRSGTGGRTTPGASHRSQASM